MSSAWINWLKVRTIDADRDANVAICSVPLPREDHAVVTFDGMASQALPLAWYPAGPNARPDLARQVLVMGVADDAVPDELGIRKADEAAIVNPHGPCAAPIADDAWAGPKWQSTIVEEKKTGVAMREVNELTLEHDGRRIGLRMGIELNDGGYHWWQWLQVERLWTGPACTAIRAAGYIPVVDLNEDELFGPEGYNSGHWLHRHNWLFGEIHAQIFNNGLVRITARHVNNRFFDQGQDLEGLVPVLAFNAAGTDLPDTAIDGTRVDFTLGADAQSVQLDVDRGAEIVSPDHPGRIHCSDDLVVYHPCEGTEMLLGDGDPADRWTLTADQRRMWKGMARSFEFDLSLASEPIRTRRYLPPYGWQGIAGALWPDAALPARGPLDMRCDQVLEGQRSEDPDPHGNPWCNGRSFQGVALLDGEEAHGLMRQAYRTAQRDVYDAAHNRAYAYADFGIDHADFTHQITGMAKGSISLVLHRNLGMLAAYLENGDPYLLRCSESLADNAYIIDRSNWPRRSYGRDSAYIRSLTRLYDVTGQSHYLDRAGEACRRVAQCQRDDGSFADQGGTIGPHAHLNEIIKPWMNSILSEVLVEYLERAGSDPVVEACLIRTADWLLTQLLEDEQGKYWPYQVAWGRNTEDPMSKWSKDGPPRKHPVGDVQLDYNARTMLWLSRRTGDPKYARAWQATYQRRCVQMDKANSTHYHSIYHTVKVPDNFPWHEAHLWGAEWDGEKVTFDPMLDLLDVGREAVIELPDGRSVHVHRTADGVEVV